VEMAFVMPPSEKIASLVLSTVDSVRAVLTSPVETRIVMAKEERQVVAVLKTVLVVSMAFVDHQKPIRTVLEIVEPH